MDMDYIANFNISLLSRIRELHHLEIEERISSITAHPTESSIDIREIVSILKSEGIVVVKDVINRRWVKNLAVLFNNMFKNFDLQNLRDFARQMPNVSLLMPPNDVVPSYEAMAKSSEVTILIRSGDDSGMVDIFNIDRLIGNGVNFRESIEKLSIFRIFPQNLKNINLYVNRSVIKTRGFHVDCFFPSFKIFIYLTDVSTLDDGPYCFVKRSAGRNVYSEFNRTLSETLSSNRTETPLFDFDNLVPVLGEAGTIVISDQSGIHRGFPQKSGAERMALVCRI